MVAGTVAGIERAVVARAMSQTERHVVSGLVATMVRQAMCAVVVEVVCRFVAEVMSATDCATKGEIVTAMVSGTKAGALAHMPGDATGARQAGVHMSARSADARRRSGLASPSQTRIEVSGASERVTGRLTRSDTALRTRMGQRLP